MLVNKGWIIQEQEDQIKLLKHFSCPGLPASVNVRNPQPFKDTSQWQKVALETRIRCKGNKKTSTHSFTSGFDWGCQENKGPLHKIISRSQKWFLIEIIMKTKPFERRRRKRNRQKQNEKKICIVKQCLQHLLWYRRSWSKHSTASWWICCNHSSGTKSEGPVSNRQLLYQIASITLIKALPLLINNLVASQDIPQRNSFYTYWSIQDHMLQDASH